MSKEIHCSNVSRKEAICLKEEEIRSIRKSSCPPELERISQLWEGCKIVSTSSYSDKEALKASVVETIDSVTNYLIGQGVIKKSTKVRPGDISTVGLDLFKEDLLRRADTKFIEKIPKYMEKFMSYIVLLEGFSLEDKKTFLIQFPPNEREEYQCNDGAKTRLEDVYENANPSPIVVKANNRKVADIATEFRKTADQGLHPHVVPFVNYLIGVNERLVRNEDGYYLNPRGYVSLQQVYKTLESYERSLSQNYLDIVRGNKEGLIREIIEITKQDNVKAAESEVVDIYGRKEVVTLLVKKLDIDRDMANEIVTKISDENQIGDSDRFTYWLKEVEDGVETKEASISDVLNGSIDEIIRGKALYFDRVFQKTDPQSSKILDLSRITDIIASTSTMLENPHEPITDKEKNGIYALRALTNPTLSNNPDNNPIHFLAASDHLVGKKDILLRKVGDDLALQKYINRIFDVREVYLGSSNKDVTTEILYPLFHAVLTQDGAKLSQVSLSLGGDLQSEFQKKFHPANALDKESMPAIDLLLRVNSHEFTNLYIEKLPKYLNLNFKKSFLNDKDGKGRNRLGVAAFQGHDKTTRALLEAALSQGQDFLKEFLKAKDNDGCNALNIAVSQGHSGVVAVLLESILNNASQDGNAMKFLRETLNSKDSNGCNPLNIAISQGHIEALRVLLEAASTQESNFLKEFLNSKDAMNNNALSIAVSKGHVEVVIALLEKASEQGSEFLREFFNSKDRNGVNALSIAASKGYGDIVTALLNQGPELSKELLNSKDKNGNNALSIAVCEGYAEIVLALLRKAEDQDQNFQRDFLSYRDADGCNLLNIALSQGNNKIAKLLLSTTDPEILKKLLNDKDENGCNALNIAVSHYNIEIIELLLEKASTQNSDFLKNFLNATDNNGRNALNIAANEDYIVIVDRLLKIASLNQEILKELLSTKDKYYHNAINMTALGGHSATLELLLDKASEQSPEFLKELLSSKDGYGRNVLNIAVSQGCEEASKLLLEKTISVGDPKFLKEFLNAKDVNGCNVLDNAIKQDQTEMIKTLLEMGVIINKIPSKGSGRSMAIESQRSAKGLIDSIKQDNLSTYIEAVDPEKLKQAINVSVYIDTMQNKHRSPLQFAAELGKKSDIGILINKGADIYVENNKGRNSL